MNNNIDINIIKKQYIFHDNFFFTNVNQNNNLSVINKYEKKKRKKDRNYTWSNKKSRFNDKRENKLLTESRGNTAKKNAEILWKSEAEYGAARNSFLCKRETIVSAKKHS